MILTVNGQVIEVSSEVRIVVENDENELLFNFTHEGLIIDVLGDDTVAGTSSETYEELANRLSAFSFDLD